MDEALLTLVECRDYLERGVLPDNFFQRAEALRCDRDMRARWGDRISGPSVRQDVPTLSDQELELFLAAGVLPDDFGARCRDAIRSGGCSNCDGVRDMNVVMRVLDDAYARCPMCCDPETGEVVTVDEREASTHDVGRV